MKFSDWSYARAAARFFCAELLRNGVTTALVNCATYPQSVHALFEETTRRGMRMAAGKVLMDCNAPAGLLDASVEQAYEESTKLIEAWHGTGRSSYAITPRFAVACTPDMLRMAGQLWREHPGTLVQAHLAESRQEVAEVSALFPRRRDYVDVYGHYGLLGPGAVFAHAVHLSGREWRHLHKTGSGVAHCPSSNLFLGSGLFSMRRAKKPGRPVHVGLGSDVAGGTRLSQLQTASEVYMVGQLDGYSMDGVKLFYLATRGGAATIGLDGFIGSLEPGHEADFVVLDPAATPMLASRTSRSAGPENLLFALAMLGDDRTVFATYIGGGLAHERDQCADPAREDRERKRRSVENETGRKAASKELRWLSYDTAWSKDLEVPLAYSPYAPGIEAYKDLLYCLHQDTVANPYLWWVIYDKQDGKWGTDRAVTDVRGNPVPTHGAPAVTHANDYLYCVHHREDPDSDSRLWWTRYNTEGPEAGWSQDQEIMDAAGQVVRSPQPAAVTVYDGLLYCVHQDMSGRLSWITYNTAERAWSTDQRIPGDITTTRPPAIERFKDHLYCVHDRGGEDLYWLTYDSKTGQWSKDQRIEDQQGRPLRTSEPPALTRYKDFLYCVYYAEDGQWGRLWSTRYGVGQGWSAPQRIGDAISSPGLDISAYDGPLFCVHRG
jgi:guanine deaminase